MFCAVQTPAQLLVAGKRLNFDIMDCAGACEWQHSKREILATNIATLSRDKEVPRATQNEQSAEANIVVVNIQEGDHAFISRQNFGSFNFSAI